MRLFLFLFIIQAEALLSKRNWLSGVEAPSEVAYLGDPCDTTANCIVPHSICSKLGETFWTRSEKFCVCRSGYHPATGYCDVNLKKRPVYDGIETTATTDLVPITSTTQTSTESIAPEKKKSKQLSQMRSFISQLEEKQESDDFPDNPWGYKPKSFDKENLPDLIKNLYDSLKTTKQPPIVGLEWEQIKEIAADTAREVVEEYLNKYANIVHKNATEETLQLQKL